MNGTCPLCGHIVAFQPSGGDWVQSAGPLGAIHVYHAVCPNCQSPYFYVHDAEGHVIHDWPNEGERPSPSGVPSRIADDWREAHKDLGIQTWKSAATMARRAVQGVCINKGAAPAKLAAQIKELAANNTLHPVLVDWAHQVRLFGNDGAHPGDDALADITEADAREAVAFLDQLLDWIYVMPGRLGDVKARSGQPPVEGGP
jgi:Domain of unknown function (DUF4145)